MRVFSKFWRSLAYLNLRNCLCLATPMMKDRSKKCQPGRRQNHEHIPAAQGTDLTSSTLATGTIRNNLQCEKGLATLSAFFTLPVFRSNFISNLWGKKTKHRPSTCYSEARVFCRPLNGTRCLLPPNSHSCPGLAGAHHVGAQQAIELARR